LDRQANHGQPRTEGLCSTAATGMGFIALALASAPPYLLLSPRHATGRIRAGIEAALERLPHDRGILPHFVESPTGRVIGCVAYARNGRAGGGGLVGGRLAQGVRVVGPGGPPLSPHRLAVLERWRGSASARQTSRRSFPGLELGPPQRRDGLHVRASGGRGR